jgi:hypothetical protein
LGLRCAQLSRYLKRQNGSAWWSVYGFKCLRFSGAQERLGYLKRDAQEAAIICKHARWTGLCRAVLETIRTCPGPVVLRMIRYCWQQQPGNTRPF